MTTFRRLAGTVLPVALLLGMLGAPGAAGGATRAPGFPVTLHDPAGTVRLDHRPTAIVSLSPTATEILYAIGAGSQVKAVTSYSDYPTGKTPVTKLTGNTPNVEAIAAYRPDLVVVAQDSSGLNHGLDALGIPVLDNPAAATLAQSYAQYVALGEATGHVAQARAEVAHVKAQLAAIVRRTPKPSPPATYYFELGPTYFSVTSDTFIGHLLGLLGLKSIADAAKGAAAAGGYPQLNAEFILKENPTFILLADTLCCGQSASTVSARPGWSDLSAVKDGNVVPLNDDIASRWGPRVVDLLAAVGAAVRQRDRR